MKQLQARIFLAAILVVSHPAYAQLSKGKTALQQVLDWVSSLALVCATLALVWWAIKMMFSATTFKELSGIFWGSVVAGAAGGIVQMFFV